MMLTKLKSNTLTTGLAMFSMFFGAGNIVFPLAVGIEARQFNAYALIGLAISAVAVPFLGLISMTVFDGDYRRFFARIGVIPGILVATLMMGLIGPFGAIPRCITLTYATTKQFYPDIAVWPFSLFSCLVIYAFTFRPSRMLDLLGYLLTPLLLLTLTVMVAMGIVYAPDEVGKSLLTPQDAFVTGLLNGYQTMDLIGAFFFANVVLVCLQQELDPRQSRPYHQLVVLALKASLISMTLLLAIYASMGYLAAFHADELASQPPQNVLGQLALMTLGPYAGVIACSLVALACLTTAIGLSAVFAQFLYRDVMQETINFQAGLIATLVISFFVSTFEFTGIAAVLRPILQVCYPSLIVLAVVNLLHQLTGFRYAKIPVYTTFAVSLTQTLWSSLS